jgi:nicotinamide phosphoribosyltransferase
MSRLRPNTILLADCYKYPHWLQIPHNTDEMYAYIESRGTNLEGVSYVRPFGIQGFIKDYLEGPVIEEWMIDEAVEILGEVFETHEYFNEKAFRNLLNVYGGYLPIEIKAVEEGKRVGLNNVLVTSRSTGGAEFAWIAPWIETMLLRASWYPRAVCTISSAVKDIEKRYAEICGCELNPFFLNDFGSRGVSSHESAELGGSAHLVNYLGTDNVESIRWAKSRYGNSACGYSVFATEHSTTTIYGKANEVDAYRHFLTTCPKDKICAMVMDSYDIENAIKNIIGKELKDLVMARDMPTVFRPDSGDPVEMSLNVITWLWDIFGGTINKKGFKVLNPKIKVLYGDGINLRSIDRILYNLVFNGGFSIENIMFGMGGKLLQGVDRDTFKDACKLSCAIVNGVEVEVYKDPVTDHGKRSKRGKLKLIFENGEYATVQQHERPELEDQLDLVFLDGKLMKEQTFDQIRKNAQD